MMFTTDLDAEAWTRPTRRSRAGSMKTPTSSLRRLPAPGTSCLHRDMGPHSSVTSARWVAPPQQPWQDPVPAVDHELIDDADVASLKKALLDVRAVDHRELVATAWACGVLVPRHGQARRGQRRLASGWRRRRDWAVQRPRGALGKAICGPSRRSRPTSTRRPSGGKKVSLRRRRSCWAGAPRSKRRRRQGGRRRDHVRSAPAGPTRRRSRPTRTRWRNSRSTADGFRNYLHA